MKLQNNDIICIYVLCSMYYISITMGNLPEIKNLVSCILYLVYHFLNFTGLYETSFEIFIYKNNKQNIDI